MKILGIDTATESASCAVIESGKVLGEIVYNYKKQHSVILMEMIDSILKNLKLDITDIDAFAVSEGPGSFTGLRIGAAVVKGLSQGTGKPLVGVSTLDSLAFNMAFSSGIICPIMDALRGNVYTALYEFENEILVRKTDYLAISVDELIGMLDGKNSPVCFIGDAVSLYRVKLSQNVREARFAPLHLNVAKAASLAELGMIRLEGEGSSDLHTFAPFYLRKSQAEREYEKRLAEMPNEHL